jgi:hypothetical protein
MSSSVRIRVGGFALAVFACLPLQADFVTIPQPTAAYVGSTRLLDFLDPEGTIVGGLSDGVETLIYNNSLTEYTVPQDWKNWATPPAVETSTPRIGFTGGFSSLWISLLRPATTFGFEVGPDAFSKEETTAAFYSGDTLIGSIELQPDGEGGALLVAASTTTNPFTSVVITNLAGDDFAIARQRYTLAPVPEPATFLLICAAIGGIPIGRCLTRGRTRRASRVLPRPM